MVAAYTYIDAKVTQSNGVDLGKVPLWIPRNMASAWADYTIQGGQARGLGFGFGVRYIGDSFGDAANTLTIPSYTLYDAAIRYELAGVSSRLKGGQIALNVANLSNKTYVSECTDTNCLYGVGRTVTATLRYQW